MVKMKPAVLISVIGAVVIACAGCQPRNSSYRYQTGSLYEYQQLMKAWIPNNGTDPPLPPTGQLSTGRWVQVSETGQIQPDLADCGYQPGIYVAADYGFGCHRPGGFGRHRLHRRRYYRGTGFSIGFHYGSSPFRLSHHRFGDCWP